jgi:hypothetical protein
MPTSVGPDPLRPFTRADALAAGLTDDDLRSDTVVRVFRGVYVGRAATRTLSVRAQAALRVAPASAMVSHHTAAALWGGAVPQQSVIHITVPAGRDCQVDGIRTHRYLDVSAASVHRGIRITSPERTLCDLGRSLALVELVTLGDRLVRRDVTSPLRLIRAADDWTGPKRRLLQRASRLVRPGVDSPRVTPAHADRAGGAAGAECQPHHPRSGDRGVAAPLRAGLPRASAGGGVPRVMASRVG